MNVVKKFSLSLTLKVNKLEHFFRKTLQPNLIFVSNAGAYPNGVPFIGSPLGTARPLAVHTVLDQAEKAYQEQML